MEGVDNQQENNEKLLGGVTGKGFMPGVSGNPAGRPRGKTMKEFAREYYLLKTDEEKRAYIEFVEKERPGFAWEMAEGKAKQDVEIDASISGPSAIRLDE